MLILFVFVLAGCATAGSAVAPGEPPPANLRPNVATTARLVEPSAPPAQADAAAPDIIYTLNGTEQRLSALRGQKVVLNFWATWCTPCRAEMPELEKLANSGAVIVLGVNQGENLTRINDFLAEVPVSFPLLPDRASYISERYLVKNLPLTIFINSDGTVSARHAGPLTEAVIAERVAALR